MKPIKFNLLLDRKIIRSLDELRDNFNIDDIYDLYNKRILQKWLRLQNEHKIADELNLINEDNPKSTIEKILSTFGYEPSRMQMEIYAHLYDVTRRNEATTLYYKKKSYSEVVEEYHQNYLYLKEALHSFGLVKDENSMMDYHFKDEESRDDYDYGVREIVVRTPFNKLDLSSLRDHQMKVHRTGLPSIRSHTYKSIYRDISYGSIRATVDEIGLNYLELLRLDIFNFFKEFIDESPIVIMSCLMNNEIRKLILGNSLIASMLQKSYKQPEMIDNLEPYLQYFEGDTEGMWKYLGETNKKYLVLNMTEGKSSIGEQSDLRKDFTHEEVNGSYLILDGLAFKSASSGQSVRYLEVEV